MKPVTPRLVVMLQDRLVHLLGSSADGRAPLVGGMLRRDASEATSYWLQLVVSIGIATLGLVVGSSAVVIGAMLVAPLMGPIVGLAMGLAAGSPFLVLRSAGRIGLSVVVGIGGAASITLLLPFHELNAEISARASPTVLDLITAGFCALAGVYASLRPGSDTAATAAGTSIGISLVPPLCASGYGLGTAAWPIAGGAALLFLTNLVAIVVVGTVSFVAAGFNRVDVVSLERDELAKEGAGSPIARSLARRLSRQFESRWGPVLRFLMPFVLLAAVYVPLRRALDEVAWQVRVRSAIREAIAREQSHVIENRVRVEHHEVEVVVVLLGSTEDANTTRTRMDATIRQASGVRPRLEIFAVPDAASFAGLESTLLTSQVAAAPVAPPPPPPDEPIDAARAKIRTVVEGLWPATAAGEALVIDVGTAESGPLRIRVVHIGAALGADGAEMLERSIESGLGRKARLVDVAVPSGELTRADGDLALVAKVSAAVRATAGVPAVSVCVVRPATPSPGASSSPADLELARALDEALAGDPRVRRTDGRSWSIRFVRGGCASSALVDGGAPDARAPSGNAPPPIPRQAQ
ncbi:MAG TPA: DUF389 domain-containing protein [Polyangiaceae bacterium]|nr:DUF389 domain-containing protein [Polyangiaceae bacterium]